MARQDIRRLEDSEEDLDISAAARAGDGSRVREILSRHDFLDHHVGALDMAIAAAIRQEHHDVAHEMLDIRERSPTRLAPILVLDAALNGDLELAERIFDLVPDLATVNHAGRTPLHAAAQGGDPEIVSAVLERGGDVRARHRSNMYTPLHSAAAWGMLSASDLLINAGAELDARDREGMTALTLADLKGDDELVELLLQAGADAAHQQRHGRSPLHRAAVSGTAKEVRALLDDGADPNARDFWKETPLHLAARRDAPAILTALLEAGVDLNAQNHVGETALMLAATDPAKNHRNTVAMLLLRAPDLTLTSTSGWSILHALVYMGEVDMLVTAIGAGADIEHRDEHGETPYLTAANYLQADCLQALADAGADVTARNTDGQSAADLVAHNVDYHSTDHEIAAAIRVISRAE